MLRRKISLCLIGLIYLVILAVTPALAGSPPAEPPRAELPPAGFTPAGPQTAGWAAALIDSKSGQIVYAQNENLPLQPASTVKILTAVIALEHGRLTDLVTAGRTPSLAEPSMIGLKEGETISLENLLYALLVKSANDAAVAIAEHISGSVPEFAGLMNRRARELGATNSNFTNPHGLPDPENYSTAHDLAVIAKYAMENAEFRRFVATKYKIIPRPDDSAVKWLQNHNKLLYRYDGANGIKTGYTKQAGQCLVASARRDGQEFIAVVLGSEGCSVWTEAQNLLDYGFANFTTFAQKKAGVPVRTVSVKKGAREVTLVTGKDFYYTLPRGKTGTVSEQVEITGGITAPVKKGQVLGRVRFVLAGDQLGTVNLVAQNDVPVRPGVVKSVAPAANLLVAGVLMAGLAATWTVRRYRRRKRRRNRRYPR